jgi:predicted anti-sigma-YlaC factor YlaD
MTCEELERVLPELGDGHTIEQEAHLKSCSACSDLVADLNAISQQARLLQGSEQPSPWIWNSIEVALQQEGLIRQPHLVRSQPAPGK